ncbi:MAG: hypothetical protein RBU37_16785 [Myxococcota bacterium]|jgi:hypothetical protein|nr:hypothetical protein [Myxococcota bacterium]
MKQHSPLRLARILLPSAFAALLLLPSACDDGGPNSTDSDAADSVDVELTPVPVDAGAYTYKLSESTASLVLWTTPATHKVERHLRAPAESRSGLELAAARGEFEPAVCVLDPGHPSFSAELLPFPTLGSTQRAELSLASYQGEWPEALHPLLAQQRVDGEAGTPSVLWLSIFVPRDASPGKHHSQLVITTDDERIELPITLTVFDFDLPQRIAFHSLLYLGISQLIPNGGGQHDVKQMLFEHRFTPSSVAWPSSFHYNITWDSDASPSRCSAFYDEPDEGEAYSIQHLARRYYLGQGWNEVGFPQSMFFQFVDNATPRPSTFCGQSRGDHYGSAAYNQAWSAYLSALQAHLRSEGMLDRGYYYIQNEPQNEQDHALAAELCRMTRAAAPELRIAISEEPKPEIAEDPGGDCGYDIWIAHVRALQEDYALERQREHGESLWLYSLDHDPDPYFNPTRIDTQGMHARIIPWVSWRYRARGWAYYDAGRFFQDGYPGIRAELLREGFEDYEYLLLANGGQPRPGQDEAVDASVLGVASSLGSWTKDADALMTLRFELGRYIEGSRDTLPVLEVDDDTRPRGSYAINFQDPAGEPTASPLELDGKTYLKVGWQAWSDEDGYGWSGEHVGNPSITLYGFDSGDGYSVVQRSYLYDDYGRDNIFEFALANGRYRVTVGAGRPARGYPNDPHNVKVEGQTVIDDEATSNDAPCIERSVEVELRDGKLSMEMGGRSQSTGEWAYTFLAYLLIDPID